MNIRKIFFLTIPAALMTLSSCSSHPDIIGTWTGNPTRINDISAACDASATMSISFNANDDNAESGDVTISAIIDANQPVESSESVIDQAYEVSVAATAVITGKWTYEKDDDEDVIISLDPSTLRVNVDPHGVTFSNDILTGAQQPMLDSLSSATAEAWQKSITKAMTDEFNKLQHISDIKVNNGIMSCEISDRDFTFRKSE